MVARDPSDRHVLQKRGIVEIPESEAGPGGEGRREGGVAEEAEDGFVGRRCGRRWPAVLEGPAPTRRCNHVERCGSVQP
jgi:hypothetical protein